MPSPVQLKRRLIGHSLFKPTSLKDALGKLGFVQADPIRSPARAQDLILRHRVEDYQAGDLERAYPELDLEECYLYAYGFLGPGLWQAVHPQPFQKLTRLQQAVLDAVRENGATHPKDLESAFGKKRVKNCWGGYSKAVKNTLEGLHDNGLLRIARRDGGFRVYATANAFEQNESKEERFERILLAVAHVMGPTGGRFLLSELSHFGYLVSSVSGRRQVLQGLVDSGKLERIELDDREYLCPIGWDSVESSGDGVRVLAPFDPVVRDRDRFQHLWGWEYRFEAYTPPAKRVRGYYAMPVLWHGDIIGWANAKVEGELLNVEFGYANGRPKTRAYRKEAEAEVVRLARFLGLDEGSWQAEF